MSWNTHIPKFRRFVLQNFPFIEEDFDALTDYALICKVVEYLNNVINSQNELISEVESFETTMTNDFNRLEGLFVELKSFVDNYFDNLDVQEEINNKLDQMVEDGTLQEIIADYLNSKAVFGYDTVADMKSSTNLIDGSYARTLGYYAKNDGGGSYYKISSTQPSGHYEILTSGLYAELIIEDTIKLSQLGAKNDGTDSSSALVSALSYYDKICIDKNYTFSTAVTISSNGKEIYGLNQNINWSGTGNFITISNSNNFYLHNLTITCSSNNAINFAGTLGGTGCSDCNIENVTIKNGAKGIVSTYTWDTIFTNVRVQGSQKPLELNSQTNAILFNSCKFVSFSSKITLTNCEGIEFNCCDISNFSSNDEAINLYQGSAVFVNCYFENLGSYTRGANIVVSYSASVISNLQIIGGVLSSTGLAIYPSNAKVSILNTLKGSVYIVPRNISSTATSNPAVDTTLSELNFNLNANRYNSTIFFDGKNDVTLGQIGGGTFTQTFTNGQKELSHTDAGSGGFTLPVEANSSYLLYMDVELPEGVTSLAFAQATPPEGGYSQSVSPINNKMIIPFATKTNTTIYVRWSTTGTVKLGSLKLIKIL